jgi:hypothetical protein
MKVEALFLFLILLLGLVLCSFLGGNCNSREGFTQNSKINDYKDSSKNLTKTLSSNNTYSTGINSNSGGMIGDYSNYNSSSKTDNYNHYSGSSSQLTNGSTFTSPNGGSIVVNTSSDGTQSLQVTPSGGGTPITFTVRENMTTYSGNNGSAAKFYGPNGETALIVKTNDGQQAIKITDSNNNSTIYTLSGSSSVYSTETNTTYFGSTGSNLPSSSYNTAYTGNASAGVVTGPQGNSVGYVTGPQGNTVYGTNANNPYYNGTYYNGSAGAVTGPQGNSVGYVTGPQGNTVYGTNANYNPYYGGSAGAVTGPQGNSVGYVTGPQGNTVYGTNVDNNSSYGTDYYSTLPEGIPASQIIPGQEDLYILKSQVVPPVCPVCPVLESNADYDESKCPACPACARCPEPAFDCKKVPNYSGANNSYLPVPVLNDFSTFGM